MQKTTIVPISLPTGLAQKMDRLAKAESMSRSEFVRDMIRRRVAFAELDAFREDFSKRAKKAGIRTLQDAVRVVREIREGRKD